MKVAFFRYLNRLWALPRQRRWRCSAHRYRRGAFLRSMMRAFLQVFVRPKISHRWCP